MLIDEIAVRIAAISGLWNGGTAGVVKRGSLPATPDNAVGVQEYGGNGGTLGFGTPGIKFEEPGIHVLVRGEPDDYTFPRLVIERIYQDLPKVQAVTLSGTKYNMIHPVQPPQFFERDTSRRVTFVVNFIADKEPSSTA